MPRPASARPRPASATPRQAIATEITRAGRGRAGWVATVAGTALLGWAAFSTGALVVKSRALDEARTVASTQAARHQAETARKDRLIAATRGDIDQLASDAERRHAALSLVLSELRDEPGAETALAPASTRATVGAAPRARIEAVRDGQAATLERADAFSRQRSDELRRAFRAAGIRPPATNRPAAGLGGPLIALPGGLGEDPAFAQRFARVAATLGEMRVLDDAASALPFGKPTADSRLSSGFGVRIDPITSTPAFHSGQDFAGAYRSPVTATAAGVVSFVGARSGYGNTVEVEHGQGFKTRYAHLAAFAVRPGQIVTAGQTLGAMGSTGRSTGVHLHYEVWAGGRAQNPARFLKAGAYVHKG